MTDEERSLADELDAYMAKPSSREDQAAADRRRSRDYTNLDSEGVSLAMRLDRLTNVRP